MKPLAPFEFVPSYQPEPDSPVSFRLNPLDLRGQYEIQASLNKKGVPSWDGIEAASGYIVGWKGDRLGEFSRARVRQIVNGDADSDWMIWLGHIAAKLYTDSLIPGGLEKKS